jgi:hypothetical protein
MLLNENMECLSEVATPVMERVHVPGSRIVTAGALHPYRVSAGEAWLWGVVDAPVSTEHGCTVMRGFDNFQGIQPIAARLHNRSGPFDVGGRIVFRMPGHPYGMRLKYRMAFRPELRFPTCNTLSRRSHLRAFAGVSDAATASANIVMSAMVSAVSAARLFIGVASMQGRGRSLAASI